MEFMKSFSDFANKMREESEAAKAKKPDLDWYQEPKYFLMEISRDRSWINKPFFEEFEPVTRRRRPPMLSTFPAMMFGFESEEEVEPVKLAFAFKNNEIYIKQNCEGIEVEYRQSINKAVFNQSKMIDLLHYFEYSLYGIWLFTKMDGGLYRGVKVAAKVGV